MSHTENEFLRKIAEQAEEDELFRKAAERGKDSGKDGERGGRYFGGKSQELGSSVSGEIESTEVLRFGQTNSIEDIINTLNSLPQGALMDSANMPIDKNEAINSVESVKQFIEAGAIVPVALLRSITGEQGFRAAVIREIIKSRENFFASANNLDQIIRNFENIIAQNITLQPFKNGEIILKDSSEKPIDVQGYIDNLKYTKNWLANNPGQPLENNFYKLFTGNYGIRAAIMRATGR